MRTVTTTSARETVAPTLHKAQETLTDTVIPAVKGALTTAAVKGSTVLDSDVALEARRRGLAVVKAAKGDIVYVPKATRRWRFGLGMLAAGAGLGYAFTWIAKKLTAPVESYTHTMPVPSGTDGGVQTDATTTSDTPAGTTAGGFAGGSAAPAGTAIDDIDLRTGSPSTL
jgi:hypothetical protein